MQAIPSSLCIYHDANCGKRENVGAARMAWPRLIIFHYARVLKIQCQTGLSFGLIYYSIYYSFKCQCRYSVVNCELLAAYWTLNFNASRSAWHLEVTYWWINFWDIIGINWNPVRDLMYAVVNGNAPWITRVSYYKILVTIHYPISNNEAFVKSHLL